MQISYYWWVVAILFLVSLVNLGLGAVVIQSGRSARHWWFLGVAVSSFAWIVTNALFTVVSGGIQELIALACYGSAVALAVSFLGFAYTFMERRLHRVVATLYLLGGAVIGVGSMVPGLLLVSATSDMTLETNALPLLVYGLFVASSLIGGVVVLIKGYETTRGKRRHQVGVVLAGAVAAGGIGIVCNLVAPMFGNYSLVQVGPLGIIVFVIVTAYAVARHGMFDVRRAVARTSMYTMSLAVLSGLYVVLAYGISAAVFGVSSDQYETILSPLNVILALVLVFLFQPVKNFFDRLTNSVFYQGEYSHEAFSREFGRILAYDTDLRLLLQEVSSHLASHLKAEHVFFYISGRGVMGSRGTRKARLPAEDVEQIAEYYAQYHSAPEVILAEAVQTEAMQRLLSSHSSDLVLPLTLHRQTVGYVFIGEHMSRGYTVRDIRLLESIANELTIAVQNSLSVEEIRELNETLQRRIDDATSELRLSNRQLQRLDEAKDEFISMASHQLRTPLTSIKGYLDMMLQGDLGKVTATQRAVLSEAFISSERMVTLINDFLNVSRLQTGKFTIERRESDLVEAMQEQLQMLEVVAKQHDLTLRSKIDKNLPKVAVDIDKIRQVMLNMIDNAIFYSKPGTTVNISLAKEGDVVAFRVRDTGIGVPVAEQPGLFSKFFRATNARKKRPDGTGVGLFLAKKVILAHGGRVLFESKEGKGSTFGFTVPLA